MEAIKPIETVYNGYKFRSRLEARWAVFFDSVGIRYEYEPDGIRLDDERHGYLPDFYLSGPEFDMFAEVKPRELRDYSSEDELHEAEWKIRCLHEKTNKPCIICFGDPFNNDILFYSNTSIPDNGGGFSTCEAVFGSWVFLDFPPFLYVKAGEDTKLVSGDWNKDVSGLRPAIRLVDKSFDLSNLTNRVRPEGTRTVISGVYEAKERARQMRFEHKEYTFTRRPVQIIHDSFA